MTTVDAELRREAATLEVVRSQMDALARQAETLQLALDDVGRARETLESARSAGAGRETLVPIGANSFVFGQIRDPERVIVGIGSDVAIEQSASSAIQRLESRAGAIEEAERNLAERLAQLERQAGDHSRRIQELYEKGGGAPPG